MLERKNGNGVRKNADDDGGDTVEQVRGITHDESGGPTAELGEINGAQESDGNAEKGSEQKQFSAADDCIGHAPAGFTDRNGQLGEEVPTDRDSAMIEEIPKNEEKNGNRDEGAQAGHGQHEAAHKFAPTETSAHVLPTALPFWEVATMRMRASPLRIKVRRKRTRPSSIRD